MAYYRRTHRELARLLQAPPISNIDDVVRLYERLGSAPHCSDALRAACELILVSSGNYDHQFLIQRLFGAISRWALEALTTTTEYALEPVWNDMGNTNGTGSPRRRVFTASQCRGILANLLLLNVQDPVGTCKSVHKIGGLRLDRSMLRGEIGANKMACLLQYFAACLELEGTEDDDREVVFERRTGERSLEDFEAAIRATKASRSTTVYWPPAVLHDGRMEAIEQADAFCNFANQDFGYGGFIASATQEEIMQVCCPEFNVGMFFIGLMGDTEVIVVHGCRRYSRYTGYLNTFKYAGAWTGPPDIQSILTMDAVYRHHFRKSSVLRDIQKAALCFAGHSVVSTGRWGCGAFGGMPAHKFVQQFIAAMMVGNVQLQFSTFGTPDGCDRILNGIQALRGDPRQSEAGLIGRVLDALLSCCDERPHYRGLGNTEFVDRFLKALTSVR